MIIVVMSTALYLLVGGAFFRWLRRRDRAVFGAAVDEWEYLAGLPICLLMWPAVWPLVLLARRP